MKNLNKSVPRSGNVSVVGGGVHSFAVSYLKTVNGTVEAKDVDLPYFYICPLSEGALTVRCLNQNEDVVLPAALISANIGSFLPIQVRKVVAASDIIIGL